MKKENELIAKTTIITKQIQVIIETLKIHTFLIFVLMICFSLSVGYQTVSNAWQGEYLDIFHDYLDEENHLPMIQLWEIFGKEHPLKTYHKKNEGTHRHKDHAHHHSKLHSLVENHWQTEYLVVFSVALSVTLLTFFLRFVFYFDYNQTSLLMPYLFIFVFSIFIQVLSGIMFTYLLFHYPTWISLLSWSIQGSITIIELASFLEIKNLRGKIHFLKLLRKNSKINLINAAMHQEPHLREKVNYLLQEPGVFKKFFNTVVGKIKEEISFLTNNYIQTRKIKFE